jgi:Protein of unknown function (DUF4231)
MNSVGDAAEPVVNQRTHQIALARCEYLTKRYLGWKQDNYRKSTLAQAAALACTAIIPVVLLIPLPGVNVVGAAFSALAAIATGLLAITGWRDNFVRYGHIYHMLEIEKNLYLTRATNEYWDTNAEQGARNFAKRLEGLVTLDVTEWRTEMQRLQERSQRQPNAGT